MRLAVHPLAEMREYGDLMLIELRKVIPEFLKRVDVEERGVAWSALLAGEPRARRGAHRAACSKSVEPEARDEVTLVDWDPEGELKIAAAVLYASSRPPRRPAAVARRGR